MKRKPLKRVFSVVCAAVLVLSIPAGAYAEMYYLEQGSVEDGERIRAIRHAGGRGIF